jgi:hypothetical protein
VLGPFKRVRAQIEQRRQAQRDQRLRPDI